MAAPAPPRLRDLEASARRANDADGGLIGVLGPTNTGKTYFAIERLLAHRSGMIGLPLRLLAREVYDKLVLRIGSRDVALVTGEEKIVPPNPRYWVSTVEAMPLEREVECLAIDEIQLANDPERGRVFTSRLLHARGRIETIFIGAETMRPILRRLFPRIEFVAKERFSQLTHIGSKKVSRLPRRSAVVAFSVDSVYAIAELIRRQRGGAAVVLGALSPRTRNAQAELYQEGEVDYLVATDAIGMGLNMDIDHVAFAAKRKFDGRHVRDLRPDELAQIAGRAGRHVKDGTFGVTADCFAFDDDMIAAIEAHAFDPIDALQWRADTLDFSSLAGLRRSLDAPCPSDAFRRARPGEDEAALARLSGADGVADRALGTAAVALLWDVCQVPDFRKSAHDQHVRLLEEIYGELMDRGRLSSGFLAPRVDQLDRTDGDIDAISTRIAFIRTWTYLSNRAGWIDEPAYWQDRTRSIEDALSDALHLQLTQRFVDRRTSVLMRRLRDDAPLLAGVNEDGEVFVEGQFVGRLTGFQFILDPRAKGVEAKRVKFAAERALTPLLAARAAALANAEPSELDLRVDGSIWWRSSPVARLEKGPAQLRPQLRIDNLDAISPNLRGRVEDRLQEFLASKIETSLADLIKLKLAVDAPAAEDDQAALSGLSRGIAFRLVENFGAMSRAPISGELKQLDQKERGKLRKLGVRFGEITMHMPTLLKPGPAQIATLLWALWTGRPPADMQPPKAGLVSIPLNADLPHAYYYASGYRPSGTRAVRIDMLERLAGLIRTAREGAGGREGFEATQQMMSLVGCSGEDFEGILKSLGYRKNTVRRPAQIATPATPTPTEPPVSTPAPEATSDSAAESAPSDGPTAAPAHEATEGASAGAPQTEDLVASEATGGNDEQASAPMAASEAPEASGQVPSPPSSSDPQADATADAAQPVAEPELVDVVLWKAAPRRPPAKPGERRGRPHEKAQSTAAGANGGADGRKDADHRPGGGPRTDHWRRDGDRRNGPKGRPKGKGGRDDRKGDGARQPRQFTSGPARGKGPDPDSPFAILAALKAPKGDDPDGA
ncbi:MAG: hypothetical protein GC152_07380 [Alphaproteobacteria bacterium]|nr:hypothetical protein [Alphaproteobacteria bacterium]